MKVSIVVPVYQVERYLQRCVDSILCQTYRDIEILLIDDGSTDGSGKLCDDYAQKDTRVQTFHKKNGGLSDARNFGLRMACGEWVLFVDSDDYIAPDAIQHLVHATQSVQNAQIVIGRYCKQIEGDPDIQWKNKETFMRVYTGRTYLERSLADGSFLVTAWSKMYRRVFLQDNDLEFPVGLIHEDEFFTPLALLKADCVIDTGILFYVYMVRPDSIMTGNKQIRNARSVVEIVHHHEPLYKQEKRILRCRLEDHSATIYYQALKKISKVEAESERLIDYSFLKRNSHSMKNCLRFCALKISFALLKKL